MKAERDPKTGKCLIQYRYTDWQGKRRKSMKRGFATKREAEEWAREFLSKKSPDFNMKFKDFVALYFEDMETRLRASTISRKHYLIDLKILPYFGEKPVNEISVADIRAWQNEMLKGDYSQTYLRGMNNEIKTIFNYAVKYYDLPHALVQSRLNSTLGKKTIVVPSELEEKMKNNPELAEKVLGKVETFIQNHPTRPRRVLSYLIALDENGDIAHFRVSGGGGHISGPSEAELRQFEEEQEAKREKKAQQEKENREYNLKAAEERKRLQEEIYNKQSAEAILQEQIVSNSKMSEIMSVYEAGTFVDGRIL